SLLVVFRKAQVAAFRHVDAADVGDRRLARLAREVVETGRLGGRLVLFLFARAQDEHEPGERHEARGQKLVGSTGRRHRSTPEKLGDHGKQLVDAPETAATQTATGLAEKSHDALEVEAAGASGEAAELIEARDLAAE